MIQMVEIFIMTQDFLQIIAFKSLAKSCKTQKDLSSQTVPAGNLGGRFTYVIDWKIFKEKNIGRYSYC